MTKTATLFTSLIDLKVTKLDVYILCEKKTGKKLEISAQILFVLSTFVSLSVHNVHTMFNNFRYLIEPQLNHKVKMSLVEKLTILFRFSQNLLVGAILRRYERFMYKKYALEPRGNIVMKLILHSTSCLHVYNRTQLDEYSYVMA